MSNKFGPDASPGPRRARKSPPVPRSAVRSRVAVSLLSVSYGVMVGGWSARIPDIRASAGADDATWGLANSIEVGTGLQAMLVIVAAVGRASSRVLVRVGAIGMLVDAPLAASAPGLGWLIAGMVLWAGTTALLELPVRVLKLEVQRAYGRSLLGSFGACFGFGSFAGAGIGVAAAALGVAPGPQIALCSVVLGVLLAIAWRWFPTESDRVLESAHRPRIRLRGRFTSQLILLAAIGFLIAYVASAGEQWAAVLTSDTLGAGATMGAVTYTSWMLANAMGLLIVDRLITRFGPLRFFRTSVLAAASGLGLGLAVGTPAAAIVGFAILGLGTAGVGPVIIGIAGRQPNLTPAEGLSVIQLSESPGFLVGPLFIGMFAAMTDLRIALVTVVVALLAAVALSVWVRGPTDVRTIVLNDPHG